MNTKIEYLYRDAANFRVPNACVIDGLLTDAQIDGIMATLQDGEYFVPSLVGMPERREYEMSELDHDFFELTRDGFSATDEKPDVNVTPDELVRRFDGARAAGWVKVA